MAPDITLLTHKQKLVYAIIEAYIAEKGFSPTVREIAEALGDKTPAAVQGILNRLEEKGVIRKQSGTARSIQLVTEKSNYGKPAYLPMVKKIHDRTIADLTSFYNVEKYLPVPLDIVQQYPDCLLVRYVENSLQNSGLSPQDVLVVSHGCPIVEGDSILALFQNRIFIRRYYSTDDPDILELKSDGNPAVRERFQKSEIHIVGKVIGKYRKM